MIWTTPTILCLALFFYCSVTSNAALAESVSYSSTETIWVYVTVDPPASSESSSIITTGNFNFTTTITASAYTPATNSTLVTDTPTRSGGPITSDTLTTSDISTAIDVPATTDVPTTSDTLTTTEISTIYVRITVDPITSTLYTTKYCTPGTYTFGNSYTTTVSATQNVVAPFSTVIIIPSPLPTTGIEIISDAVPAPSVTSAI
ncbi:hypothetical protein V1511DRAFT_487315 [Dipodascopsis uninucleata]